MNVSPISFGPTATSSNHNVAVGDEDRDAFVSSLNVAIMSLEASLDASQNADSMKEVDRAAQDRKQQLQDALGAMRNAREAAEDGSFWSDVTAIAKGVAEIATAAAAVASVVATGGAAAPVLVAVGACVAAGANVAQAAGCDSGAMKWMELGGGCLAGGAAIGTALCSGAAIAVTSTVATTISQVGTTVSAGAGLVGAVGVAEKGHYDEAQQLAYGDNAEATGLAKQDEVSLTGALDRLRSSSHDFQRAASIATEMQTRTQDAETSIIAKGGVQ